MNKTTIPALYAASAQGGTMKKRRHKHKRRMRITPRGYVILGALALIVCLVIFLLIRICIVYFNLDEKKKPAVKPAGDVPAATAAAPEPDDAAVTPGFTPSPTPTASPALASTGARLPTPEEEAGAVEGIIRTSNIAMRKGAGKDFDIVRKYNVGERLLVYAVENEYSLVRVLSDDRCGFIATEFITKFGLLPDEAASCTPVPAAVDGAIMGLVNVDELSLRSVPAKKGNTPIGVCKNHDLVWVYLQTGEFYYVQCAATGQKGYVFADYVMTQAPAPTGTPVPGA